MKKNHITRRAVAAFLSAVFMILAYCPVAFATNDSEVPGDSGYITFTTPTTRMESNGDFTFKFCYALTSDSFRANSTSITIETEAYIYHRETQEITTDSSKKFHLILYHDGILDKAVGGYYGYADGIYGGLTFNNLKKGDKYYFILYPDDGNMSLGPYMFTGSGKVSGVTVL